MAMKARSTAASFLLGFAGSLVACCPKEKSAGTTAAAPATAESALPAAATSGAPLATASAAPVSASKLALTCPPSTWNAIRERKLGSWQEQICGETRVSYRFYPAGGARTTGRFVLLQEYPLKGRRAAAVFKDAVESLAPNLGMPRKSRGGCGLTEDNKRTLLSVGGPGLVARAEADVRAQGGHRAAVFEADGYRLTVTMSDADPKNAPDKANIRWTDDEVPDAASYPAAAWEAKALCE
jgi:hypothetical protein